jgi:antitoxin (DNA-binding transcriptional repressor) of toxin-antitoxin stability system
MTTVTVHEAKTHLSRWINRALAGDQVVIARGKKPVVVLKPVDQAGGKRQFGRKPDFLIRMSEDFDAPLDDFKDYME